MAFKHSVEPTSALPVNRSLAVGFYKGMARVAKNTHAIGPLCMRAAAIAEESGRRLVRVPRSDREIMQSWLSRGHEARRLTEEIIESHVTVFAMRNLGFLGLSDLGTSRSLLERALQTSDPEALLSLKSAFESMFAKVQFRDLHFFRAVLESSFQDISETNIFGAVTDPRIVLPVMEDVVDPVLQAKHVYFLKTLKMFRDVLDEMDHFGPSKELLLCGFALYFELARITFFSIESPDLKKKQRPIEEALYTGQDDLPRSVIWSILNSEGFYLIPSRFSLGGTPVLLNDGIGAARRVGVLSGAYELDIELPLSCVAHGAGIHLLAERLSRLYNPSAVIPDVGDMVSASLRMRSTRGDGNTDALVLRYGDERRSEMVVFDVREGSIVRGLRSL